MGTAEVIPGVSGGTIAFITGIYEKLLNTIKAFGPGLLPIFKETGFKGVWSAVNGAFLVRLLGGMVFGVVFGVFALLQPRVQNHSFLFFSLVPSLFLH